MTRTSSTRFQRSAAGLLASVASLALLTGCSSTAPADDTSSETGLGATIEEITERAADEQKVHLIAYPDWWANYAEAFELYTDEHGLDVEVSNPNGSSEEEFEAIRTLRGQATQPDVLDIGSSFTQQGIDEGLFQPYKPTTFDEIPDALKNPDGQWTAAYYGVMNFGVNTDLVEMPKSWDDLKDPQYAGLIHMDDPRESATAMAAVYAASLAHGGSLDDITPGIEFFAELAESGQLVSGNAGQLLSTGEAAVAFAWNFNFPGVAADLAEAGVPLEWSTPSEGIFGTYYAQPLAVDSPQQNAGALWIEWLLSDAGAISYAKAGAIPARYDSLVERGAFPAEVLENLPPAEVVAQIQFPTLEQNAAATEAMADSWGEVAAAMGF